MLRLQACRGEASQALSLTRVGMYCYRPTESQIHEACASHSSPALALECWHLLRNSPHGSSLDTGSICLLQLSLQAHSKMLAGLAAVFL